MINPTIIMVAAKISGTSIVVTMKRLLLDAGEIFPRYDSLYYSEIHDYASSVTSFMNMSFILGISSLNELTMMS